MKINLLNKVEIKVKRLRPKLKENNWYVKDYELFMKLNGGDKTFPIQPNYPCLEDKVFNSKIINASYFYQDLFIAKQIYLKKPVRHIDIGSRIDGFVAHVATFREIEVFDLRNKETRIDR